ncbi:MULTISPECIES: iron-containing alcohol dehydrogenase [unclassified Granulicatella]|uniref:iron-containing alcohol dehydrogenase n=1 Tax=unclassified Granulicatella TaxID=2630493 RepID=UPI00107428C8|nr:MULTISPECIES: iron-containing alcohol dehydrogenase [unclassified Granulicatella]MBF0779724.1 iron-containing alcohol dehydrogenase [Granulicatella sp. 19428wC4_WM01]TFU96244.1 iron-containing alcohol dehydrogenase [Granulicatella sp. WM01]
MVKFTYKNPTKLIFGQGQLSTLANEIKAFGKNILLVYGGGSIKQSGLYQNIQKELSHFNVFELSGVEPNPRVTTAQKGAKLIQEHNIDFVLAVGGGSVIDCTKLIVAAAHYQGDAWDIVIGKHIPTQATPFGTILTLAATGSEMNAGSVITNEKTQQKLGWGSPLVYPTFSILDPTYTYTLPTHQSINGIIDMMSHLIEQYFNEAEHTPVMDGMIESILRTIIQYAPIVVDNPTDYQARETLMMAGTVALNGSLRWGYLGDWSSHALEHAISAVYDIAHAEGLSIIMPNWMYYVMPKHIERFEQFAKNVFHIHKHTPYETAKAGIDALQQFWKSLNAPTRLSDKHIDASCIEQMAKHCTENGSFGRLEILNFDDALAIFRNSL